MSHTPFFFILCFALLYMNIFAYQEDEYYCRNHAEYKICRRCLDPDNNCNVEGKGCFCDNIAIFSSNKNDFIGGANCQSLDNRSGKPYCYVNEASNCGDKEFSDLASSFESLWYPKIDGYTDIYKSEKACLPENIKGNDTGNEELLEGIKINSDFLLSAETGEKIELPFELPEYKEEGDYDDYDEEPGYVKCLKQCLTRNIKSGVCGAWSYDALNAKCYLHNVDACCGQRDKQVEDSGFISGYACPHCWSTRNECPCGLAMLQTCPTCTFHNAAEEPKHNSPAGILRVDKVEWNIDLCQCIQKFVPRRKKWVCRRPCCEEGGCQDTRRCRTCKKRQG